MVGVDMVSKEPSPAPGVPDRASAPDRLSALIAAHEPRVRRLAYRLLGWREDADDIVQDVFVTAWQKAPDIDGAAMSAWLARVTINACRARIRRQRVWLRWFQARQTQTTPASAPDQERESAQDETSRRVRGAIRGLKPRDREVIVLRYLEELEVSDIARLLDISPNAVEARLSRARKRLKESLGSAEHWL